MIRLLSCMLPVLCGLLANSPGVPAADHRPSPHSKPTSQQEQRQDSTTEKLVRPVTSIRPGDVLRAVAVDGQPLRLPADPEQYEAEQKIVELHLTVELGRRPLPNRRSAAYRHQPLYFENPDLERCGGGQRCLTEFVSAGRMATQLITLPALLPHLPPARLVHPLPDCPAEGRLY